MNELLESKINDVTSDLDAALAGVEQRCQEIRWRLKHFRADQVLVDLEEEIESLLGEAFRIGVTYGEVRGVVHLESE